MAGHNKWSKVKRKKEVLDAKKSKIFSDFARQLTLASRECGGDKNSPTLRAVIDKARAANMPNDNIDRAIQKGVGGAGGNAQEVLYEAYGPSGSALLMQGYTDNKNRTSQEIKHLLSKKGLELSAPGSAMWAFTKEGNEYKAQIPIPVSDKDKESIMNLIEELEQHDDIDAVYTNAEI